MQPAEKVRLRWIELYEPLIVSLGGDVRLGLEDYQYAHAGQFSNPQIVERAATTIRNGSRSRDPGGSTPDSRGMTKVAPASSRSCLPPASLAIPGRIVMISFAITFAKPEGGNP
jgi:hypothetical protein